MCLADKMGHACSKEVNGGEAGEGDAGRVGGAEG